MPVCTNSWMSSTLNFVFANIVHFRWLSYSFWIGFLMILLMDWTLPAIACQIIRVFLIQTHFRWAVSRLWMIFASTEDVHVFLRHRRYRLAQLLLQSQHYTRSCAEEAIQIVLGVSKTTSAIRGILKHVEFFLGISSSHTNTTHGKLSITTENVENVWSREVLWLVYR